jgi:hypothetical protein
MVSVRYKIRELPWGDWIEDAFHCNGKSASLEEARDFVSKLFGRIWPVMGHGVMYEFREDPK